MSRTNSKVLQRVSQFETRSDNYDTFTSVSEIVFCGCVYLPLCHHGRHPLDVQRASKQAGFYLDCKSVGLPDITLTCEDLRPRDELGTLIPKRRN
jgi:hypothetical protein